jgi:hypothetical protein
MAMCVLVALIHKCVFKSPVGAYLLRLGAFIFPGETPETGSKWQLMGACRMSFGRLWERAGCRLDACGSVRDVVWTLVGACGMSFGRLWERAGCRLDACGSVGGVTSTRVGASGCSWERAGCGAAACPHVHIKQTWQLLVLMCMSSKRGAAA